MGGSFSSSIRSLQKSKHYTIFKSSKQIMGYMKECCVLFSKMSTLNGDGCIKHSDQIFWNFLRHFFFKFFILFIFSVFFSIYQRCHIIEQGEHFLCPAFNWNIRHCFESRAFVWGTPRLPGRQFSNKAQPKQCLEASPVLFNFCLVS